MNRYDMRKWMKHSAVLCPVCLISCKNQETGESGQVYPEIRKRYAAAEVADAYSASIRWRQDIEIYP